MVCQAPALQHRPCCGTAAPFAAGDSTAATQFTAPQKKKVTCSFLMAISAQRVTKQLLLTPQQVIPKSSPEFLSISVPLLPRGLLGAIAIVPGPTSPCNFYSARTLGCCCSCVHFYVHIRLELELIVTIFPHKAVLKK